MSNSVLIFEENKAIQGLIASTISDQVELWQESRPDVFMQLADRHSPSLIFISNADQQQDYALCRQLQQHSRVRPSTRRLSNAAAICTSDRACKQSSAIDDG